MRIFRKYHISSVSTGQINAVQTILATVIINTGAAGAILTLYDGTDNTGAVVAVIDASTKSSAVYLAHCNTGLYYELTVGAADITVTYE